MKWLSQNKGDECTASGSQNKDSRNALACVLGHNSVCYIQSPEKEEDLAEYKIVHCEEKCILYPFTSALIIIVTSKLLTCEGDFKYTYT